ncbi:hypothetical protein [Pantoea sp. SM3]|uniref:hypothetical protein n=1 Tax=Pantoea sp. SM3 TaxID=1628192 RepID=UPI000AAC4A95
MPFSCYLLLNRREMTNLNCPGIGSFPAFSGQDKGRNNPDMTAVADIGPLGVGATILLSGQQVAGWGHLESVFSRKFMVRTDQHALHSIVMTEKLMTSRL